MKNEKVYELKTNKLTGKSWVEDCLGVRRSKKFKVKEKVIVDDYTWVMYKEKVEIDCYTTIYEDRTILLHSRMGIISNLKNPLPIRKEANDVYIVGETNSSDIAVYDGKGDVILPKAFKARLVGGKYISCKDPEKGKWGLYSYAYAEIIPPISDCVIQTNSYGYAIAYQDKTALVLNMDGKLVVKIHNCEYLQFLTENVLTVQYKGKLSVVSLKGESIIPETFKTVSYERGYIIANNGKGLGVYDLKGKKILDHEYDTVNIYAYKIVAKKVTEVNLR